MRNRLQNIANLGLIGLMNLAVGGMFYVLNMPRPPVYVITPVYAAQKQVAPIVGVPTRVVVPSVGIDLLVVNGSFDSEKQEWYLSDDKAQHADVSVPVNDSNGTTLIYGHDRPAIFAPLHELPDEAVAYVFTKNKLKFIYKYQSLRTVMPSDVSVFTVNGTPSLVLQTCTGDWDEYRALYRFSFEKVEKA